MIRIQVSKGRRQGGDDLISRQQLTNNTGTEGQHLLELNASQLGQRVTSLQSGLHSRLAGSRIGIAGIDQQIARGVLEVLTAQGNRGGTKGIQGKNTGDARTLNQLHDHDILAPCSLYSGRGDAQTKTWNGVQNR